MEEILYKDIKVGDYAEAEFKVTADDIYRFAEVSHDYNPIHTDAAFASKSFFGQRIAHGMLAASYISGVAGSQMPGPNTLYLSQTLEFRAPVFIGDTLTVRVTVTAKRDDKKILVLSTDVWNQDDKLVITGEGIGKKVR